MKDIKKLEKAIYKRKHTKKRLTGEKQFKKKHEQPYGASLYKKKPESWME